MNKYKNLKTSIVFMLFVIVVQPTYGFDENKVSDPLEALNRITYAFNTYIDVPIKFVAKTYSNYMPSLVQAAVFNFFHNLGDVNTMINQTLQLGFQQSFYSAGRILVNTTIGIGGLIEIQERPEFSEDFGQTLGYWGISNGPYLVLPLLGSTAIRDGVGLVPSAFIINGTYAGLTGNDMQTGVSVLNVIRTRAGLLPDLSYGDKDPYIKKRDAYLEDRAYEVANGDM